MQEPILEVTGLTKYFPVTAGLFRRQVGAVRAIKDIHFTIQQGEVLGIVGESGSGKSTIARTIPRLIEPTAGSIRFLGEEWCSLSPSELLKRRAEVQMVFQDPFASLNPRKTIGDSIGEPLRYHGRVANKEEEVEQVAAILEQVGLLRDVMWRYPHQFSGGQQQRICIGRALALHPKLIICDEAVSALDVSVQAQILNLLAHLRKNLQLSYLFISHDLSIIRYLCDKVIVLYLGKIMESASAEELFRYPKHPYTQALLGSMPRIHPKDHQPLVVLKGEIPSAMNPPSGCPFRTRCPYAQPVCAKIPPEKVVKDSVTEKLDHVYHCIL
jgi:oligopeptide/dipeptide ABC transporter ATP-binding protein